MKSKYYFHHTATVFFLLTVAVALFSWIGSIYGLGKVQSLLSPEGIRWELRHAMGNFVQTPALGIVMMLFLGFGITVHSGKNTDLLLLKPTTDVSKTFSANPVLW